MKYFTGILLIILHVNLFAYSFQSDSVDTISQFQKYEISLEIPIEVSNSINEFLINAQKFDFVLTNYTGTNPFNPDDVSLEATFVHENGDTIVRYGFYYEGYVYDSLITNWILTGEKVFKIRFAPEILGNWTVLTELKWYKDSINFKFPNKSFVCIDNPDSDGYLISKNDSRYLQFSKNNKTFIINGINIGSPVLDNPPNFGSTIEKFKKYKAYFNKTVEAKCNFIRLALVGSYTSAPEFNKLGNYNDRQKYMLEFDSLINYAENNNLYFEIVGDSYGAYSIRWKFNPYSLIDSVTNQIDCFTSDIALKYYKNRIRYIFSRWGYSKSFSVYEIINEMDGIPGFSPVIFEKWHAEIINYIVNELGYNTILTSNYAGAISNFDSKIFTNLHVTTFHFYGNSRNHDLFALYNVSKKYWNANKKPCIIDETGSDASHLVESDLISDLLYKNRLFSTFFMGNAGSAIQYFWINYINLDSSIHNSKIWYNSLLAEYISILEKDFNIDLNKQKFNPQRFPEFEKDLNRYSFDKYNKQHPLIENFSLLNDTKDIDIGWTHNRSYYWFNEKFQDKVIAGDDKTNEPIKIDWLNKKRFFPEYFYLYDLLPNQVYSIIWYSTNKNNSHLIQRTNTVASFKTNKNGKSEKIFPPFTNNLDDEYDFLYISFTTKENY